MSSSTRGGPRRWPAGLLTTAVAVLVAAAPSVFAAGVDNAVCADCHDQVSEMFHQTAHGIYLSKGADANTSCESCHGNAMAHVESGGDPALIVNPAKADQFGAQVLCLDCHKGHQLDEWAFSAHNAADISCSACHTVHAPAPQTLKKATPELCYDCHSDVRAASNMPSHHPIAEKKIDCQDCHGVHGGSGRLTQDNTGRELCFSCHAEIEGPFVYEHPPVMEDCMICHTPHGAVADKLLKQTEPALCLNCHPMHFHVNVVSVDGEWTPIQAAPDRGGVSTADGFKKGFLTKCTQCHNMVHGSDFPGQAGSTGGGTLTR